MHSGQWIPSAYGAWNHGNGHERRIHLAEMCHCAADSAGIGQNRSAARGNLIPAAWNTDFIWKARLSLRGTSCVEQTVSSYSTTTVNCSIQETTQNCSVSSLVFQNINVTVCYIFQLTGIIYIPIHELTLF